MKKRCVIFSGAPYFDVKTAHDLGADDYIIACDFGLTHARAAGVMPHLLVGDFDSYTAALPEDMEILRLPAEKDDTDTHFAARIALEKGFREVLLLAADGGRGDHWLANLATAAYLADAGVSCQIRCPKETYYFVKNGSLSLADEGAEAVSVFSWGDRAEGVTLRGLKYPLEDAVLTNRFPLGVSNAFAAPKAEISVKAGLLMIIVMKNGAEYFGTEGRNF